MPNQSEKSEMLTVYDKDLNSIGTRTRAEVHANELLHQTIRLWAVQDGQIWFQQRAYNKALFPGRFDLAATGHIDPGEKPMQAVRRETKEEIGLSLNESDLTAAGAIPFPFRRPDGKLDNEFANIYLYTPDKTPCFRTSDEVVCMASVSLEDYDKLLRTGQPVRADLYQCDSEGAKPPVKTGEKSCGPDDFCCLNRQEWDMIKDGLGGIGKHTEKPKARTAPRRLPNLPAFDSGRSFDGPDFD